MNKLKRFTVLITIIFLSSCTALDAVKTVTGFGGGGGVGVNANLQDGNNTVGQSTSTDISTDEVYGGINTTNSEQTFRNAEVVNIMDTNWAILILLIVGWMLPEPRAIFIEVKSWFTRSDK